MAPKRVTREQMIESLLAAAQHLPEGRWEAIPVREALKRVGSPIADPHYMARELGRPGIKGLQEIWREESRRVQPAQRVTGQVTGQVTGEVTEQVTSTAQAPSPIRDEIARLLTLHASGHDLGGHTGREHEAGAVLTWTGTRDPAQLTREAQALWTAAEQRNEAKRQKAERDRIVQWDLGSQPIMLVGIGDAHIGSYACDYRRLRQVAEVVSQTKGCYALQIGDLLDNMLWLPADHAASRNTMTEQVALASQWIITMAPKMLAIVSGNHENWMKKWAHLDLLDDIVLQRAPQLREVPYSSDYMILETKVAGRTIRHELRHIVQGSSMHSPAHGGKRHLRHSAAYDIDALWVGHTHRSEHYETRVFGKTRHVLQLGAYKLSSVDKFATIHGFSDENIRPEMAIVIDPDEPELQVFPDVMIGRRYFEAVSKGRRKAEAWEMSR